MIRKDENMELLKILVEINYYTKKKGINNDEITLSELKNLIINDIKQQEQSSISNKEEKIEKLNFYSEQLEEVSEKLHNIRSRDKELDVQIEKFLNKNCK